LEPAFPVQSAVFNTQKYLITKNLNVMKVVFVQLVNLLLDLPFFWERSLPHRDFRLPPNLYAPHSSD